MSRPFGLIHTPYYYYTPRILTSLKHSDVYQHWYQSERSLHGEWIMKPAELTLWLGSDIAPVLTQILDFTDENRARWTAAFGASFGPDPAHPRAQKALHICGKEKYRQAVKLALADYCAKLREGDDWFPARFAGFLHLAAKTVRDETLQTAKEDGYDGRVKPRGSWVSHGVPVPPNVIIHERPRGTPMDMDFVRAALETPYTDLDVEAALKEIESTHINPSE